MQYAYVPTVDTPKKRREPRSGLARAPDAGTSMADHWLPIHWLQEFSPFREDVWLSLHRPITILEVTNAIARGRFQSKPVDSTAHQSTHVARIAYLVAHGWDDALCLDAGLIGSGQWPILDGNHRHAAAIYGGASHILVAIDGSEDAFEAFLKERSEFDVSGSA